MRLTKQQTAVAQAALDTTLFVEGMAGTGKTTAGTRRLRYLLDQGVPGDSILVLVPQKALSLPYRQELQRRRKAGGNVTLATIGSLSLQMVDLFWPLASEQAGFKHAHRRPTFLSLELVQYYMARVLGPVIEQQDYFNSVRIDRNRLYSQIVDNLNKSAVVGFPYAEIGQRLKAALPGDITQQYIYDEAQDCANRFRDFCREHNLLDFSYQVELFTNHLWPQDAPRRYLVRKYRHLIVDNLEEDNPATHEILAQWLGLCASAVVIYDSDAGYRRFLGSDTASAYRLKRLCREHVEIEKTYVMSPDVQALHAETATGLKDAPPHRLKKASARAAIAYADNRYYTEMIVWAADSIASLIHDEGTSPGEIVVLAPLLSDALRFSLANHLDSRGVPVRSHRPSRALRDEPAARALLALAKVAHPEWGLPPPSFDITYGLMAAISGFDLTRARLLTQVLYRERDGTLASFDQLRQPSTQARIGFALGERYETLFRWLDDYRQGERAALDFFFSRLFGEVLSQPGFGFHHNFEAAGVAANLIDSARSFRWTVESIEPDLDTGREYIGMVDGGLIANQYLRDWELAGDAHVLVAPAYTYLMSNRPADYQFWLNIGSGGWSQRLYQPLTHPYVLSLEWPPGDIWTDDHEQAANQDALYRLVSGLIRRCRRRVYLGYSQYGEQGYEQRSDLLELIQRVLKRLPQEAEHV